MSKYVVQATWDDAPHLTAEVKEELWKSIPEYQRDARSKGIPQLGSGAVYQVPESEIRVHPFPLPRHWPRAFGFDTANSGPTAAVWGALDRESDVLYLYHAYKRAGVEPAVHIATIKARGEWIPGVGDAAAITNADGEQFIYQYRRMGLDVELADKSVEAGILDVFDRLTTGRLKVFSSCEAWFEEYRIYRRDDKGRIVKTNDHLLDSTRYLVRSGLRRAKCEPLKKKPVERRPMQEGATEGAWMRM